MQYKHYLAGDFRDEDLHMKINENHVIFYRSMVITVD